MDVFTDVDIFKEIIHATLRGVVVYVLLDDSNFKSFYIMSQRLGVHIQDLKKMRVRTVEGEWYQCQSGRKFHGGSEQKFMLVDCKTVLYGTYSYTWTYEKINLSMVLVITGQLVWSYDEEFRRLFARSTVPAVLSRDESSGHYLRNGVGMHRTSGSRISLDQIHRSRMMNGIGAGLDDNAAPMTRGLSVQERLHHSHYSEMGSLVRGYNYGGDPQKFNSRLKMGTRDIGMRNKSNMRGEGDLLAARRLQQQIRYVKRYGADQNLIPFNSEMSLHKWKINTYLNENDLPVDGSHDSISPYSSHSGLNEYQSQVIHSRSREIKARIEEKRQKRLSLQDYVHLRKSQESLRSMYSNIERPTYMSSLRSLDMRQGVAELEPNGHDRDLADHKGPNKGSTNRDRTSTDGHPSVPHPDFKMDRKRLQTYDPHEPPSMISAAELNLKLNDPSLKLSHLQSSSLSLQHPRAMESLTEVPEEKETSNTHIKSSESAAHYDKSKDHRKHDKVAQKENSVKSSLPAEPWHGDQTRKSQGSLVEASNHVGSTVQRGTHKSASSDEPVHLKPLVNTYQPGSSHTERRREEPAIQRKNSMRMKVQSMFTSDEKKTFKKEEKSLQRKASVKSQHSFSSADKEKQKSPFPRLSSYRSSKKKTGQAADPDQGSRSSLDSDGMTVSQTTVEKAYSRYEFLVEKSSSLKRQDSGYQTQSGTEKKLGRFMQRVGNLMGKNK